MKYDKLHCLRSVHFDLCRAIERKWELQESCNFHVLIGMRMFSDNESDLNLLNKIIYLYNHDRHAFLNFDFSKYLGE